MAELKDLENRPHNWHLPASFSRVVPIVGTAIAASAALAAVVAIEFAVAGSAFGNGSLFGLIPGLIALSAVGANSQNLARCVANLRTVALVGVGVMAGTGLVALGADVVGLQGATDVLGVISGLAAGTSLVTGTATIIGGAVASWASRHGVNLDG